MEDGSQTPQRLTEGAAVCEGNRPVGKIQLFGDRRQSRIIPSQEHRPVSELDGPSSRQFPAVPVSPVDPPVAHGETLLPVPDEISKARRGDRSLAPGSASSSDPDHVGGWWMVW